MDDSTLTALDCGQKGRKVELLLLHGFKFLDVSVSVAALGRWRDAGGDDVLVYTSLSLITRVTTIVRQSVNLHTCASRAWFKYVHGRHSIVIVVL